MATSPQFVSAPNVQGTRFALADGTAAKTIFTAGGSGSRVEYLFATGDNSALRTLTLFMALSAVSYRLAQIVIPAGTTALPLPVVNFLDPYVLPWIDPNNVGFLLASGCTLTASLDGALASGKNVDIIVIGGNF